MITALLMRHYKNYGNMRFVPLMSDINHMLTVYIGNNGVGKSAILEALDLVMNGRRTWNITQGEKKTEAFICPLFLIPKGRIPASKKKDIEIVSDFFWSEGLNNIAINSPAIKEFVEYRNTLNQYKKTHYLILIGISNDNPSAFFASYDGTIKKLLGNTEEEQIKRANTLKELILSLYSYLYVPVEESPTNLLQLQNETMQKLLNKNIQQEIERILNTKQENSSIVTQINKNLDAFINDVNKIISTLDPDYSFAPDGGSKKKLTAKDIRAKVIEAFFPLRSLKKGSRRVELLSSGEQRRAIIDVAYSTLMANKDRKTEKFIVLAIDEPEISMHISNCFNQFSRLEELSKKDVQVIITTHWYGYLPIAQNGVMHHLELKDGQTLIRSFNLYDLLENRRLYPDDVELKSMFDLASSLISFMRRESQHKWIFCEGSDDKLYLQAMLKGYKNIHIVPLGGCGNVVKLYQIFVGFMTEKSEDAKANVLFLIDTDIVRIDIREPFAYSAEKTAVSLKRLQIVNGEIKLVNPFAAGEYSRTEMEDCLNPEMYYEAVKQVIQRTTDRSLKTIFKKYEFVKDSKRSIFRGDNACIRALDTKYISKKTKILDFIEDDIHKKTIAEAYTGLCEEKAVDHPLAELIIEKLGLLQ